MLAYCDANGVIQFGGGGLPDGLLPIAKGPRKELIAFISAVARHAYDGDTLLVPGVPEAPDQISGVDALKRWLAWIGRKPPEGIFVFGNSTGKPEAIAAPTGRCRP